MDVKNPLSSAFSRNLRHLIVVDNEPSITKLFESYFKKHDYKEENGYKVSAFSDAYKALDFCKEFKTKDYPITAIIVDMNMPEINGEELLKEIEKYGVKILNKIMISGIHENIEDPEIRLFKKPDIYNEIINYLNEKLGTHNKEKSQEM